MVMGRFAGCHDLPRIGPWRFLPITIICAKCSAQPVPARCRQLVELGIFKYLNGCYYPRRRHSALGWKSPVALKRNGA